MAAPPSLLLLLLLLSSLPAAHWTSVITVEGRGYKGIVVAIHKDVPEDLAIVENIKTLFSKASVFLYNSTGLFFSEVAIVVPPSWSTRPEYQALQGPPFANAPVRVAPENPAYKDTPYTLQPGGCGEPGHYIHLTPWFVKELNGQTADMFGAPERQLVHEWAHLRYGVFDEYGVPGDRRYPMFYHENGKIRPTSCVRDIKGWIESRDGGPCKIKPNGQVEEDCIFIPNIHSTDAKASIMYMPFIPSMEGFCDDANYRHNPIAPTKQNAVCNYRSTWDVISHHKDFLNIRSKRNAAEAELTETLFRVLQSPKDATSRFVLVLDVSGSMNGQPMKLLHSAAVRLVEDRIPDGSHLGLVQFSTEAKILQNLTKVDNQSRKILSKSLPFKDDGGTTAIGKGLQEAIKVLKEGAGGAEGSLILLITDGEENVAPFIQEVLPEVLGAQVIVNAVAFGSEASAKLEHVTAVTGGRGYFFSNNASRPSTALDSAFLESITSQADIELQPVQLKDEMFSLEEDQVIKHVYIDEELGKDTSFTITSRHIRRVADVILRSPSGQIYDSSHPRYSRDDDMRNRIQIALPEAEAGQWTVVIRRRDEYPIVVGFGVSSEPKDIRDQPVRVRSWLSEIQLSFPAHAKVFAEVKKGYLAVVGASVLATVERPLGPTVDVQLRDDGLGADTTENDGIYSAYFTHFNGNGRYAVIARVSNDGLAKIKQASVASAGQPISVLKGKVTSEPSAEFEAGDFTLSLDTNNEREENDTVPSSSRFDRSSNGGAFRVENWTSGDFIPPGDVMDLFVSSTETTHSEHKHLVTLQFTVPGDDLDSGGQVSSLEMRVSKNHQELLTHFENGILIEDTHIIYGTLTPLPPGQACSVTVELSDHLLPLPTHEPTTLYFAVRATDDSGASSTKFNVASATFGIKIMAKVQDSTTDHQVQDAREEDEVVKEPPGPDPDYHDENIASDFHLEDERETPSGYRSFKWWPVVVGVGITVKIILIAVVIFVVVKKVKKKRNYSSVKTQQL